MTNKIKYLLFTIVLTSGSILAQDAPAKTVVADEMTVSAEQNKSWRMGQTSYSAKPKNAWELGIHLGHFVIDGDVDRRIPGGYGLGLHLRKEQAKACFESSYIPLRCEGSKSNHVIAYLRQGTGSTLVRSGRFLVRYQGPEFWEDTYLQLPKNWKRGQYKEMYTKKIVQIGTVKKHKLFSN